MPTRILNPHNIGHDEDWEGNNAAFKCPHCGKVFILSGQIHGGQRECPICKRSTGYCDNKGRMSGGTAKIDW